jgi:hypothetical protein
MNSTGFVRVLCENQINPVLSNQTAPQGLLGPGRPQPDATTSNIAESLKTPTLSKNHQ